MSSQIEIPQTPPAGIQPIPAQRSPEQHIPVADVPPPVRPRDAARAERALQAAEPTFDDLIQGGGRLDLNGIEASHAAEDRRTRRLTMLGGRAMSQVIEVGSGVTARVKSAVDAWFDEPTPVTNDIGNMDYRPMPKGGDAEFRGLAAVSDYTQYEHPTPKVAEEIAQMQYSDSSQLPAQPHA